MLYTFTLRYRLSAEDASVDELLERLAEAACGDATAGIGQPGCIALEFVRHANSAAAALEGALSDVKLAMPDAALISTDFFD